MMSTHSEPSQNKPKILVFSMGYDPFIGGAEIAITELTKRLAKYYDFHIVTCRIRRELPTYEDKGYIKIHRVGLSSPGADNDEFSRWPLKLNKWLFPFLAYFKGIRLQRKHHFDGHWCMLAYTGALGSLMFKITFPRVKYLLELQDGRSYEERKKLFGPIVFPFVRKSFQKADAIKTISTFQIEVAELMGAKAPKTRIPNGVDMTNFGGVIPEADIEAVQQKLGLKNENTYMISTTRLVARRGLEALISSLAHLPQNIHLILCGSGPHEETLRALAVSDGVIERIVWVGDVPNVEIPKYLKNANIFARPSVYEGMGNSFIEAMAAKLPVISTPVGGIVDFLFDDKLNIHPRGLLTGFVCEVDDPKGLAEQVKRVIAEPERTQKIIVNALALVQKDYDWDHIAERMHTEILIPMLSKK